MCDVCCDEIDVIIDGWNEKLKKRNQSKNQSGESVRDYHRQ